MDKAETVALLARARGGSQEAVDVLLKRCAGKLLTLVRLRMGRSLRARVESRDILQATLLKAYENIGELEAEHAGSFLGWLARIAENEILDQADFHRRQRRDARKDVAIEALAEAPARLRSALSDVVIGEQAARLERALDALPAAQREVIVLRRLEEQPFAVVGERFGISADAARMRFARAMSALTLAAEAETEAG